MALRRNGSRVQLQRIPSEVSYSLTYYLLTYYLLTLTLTLALTLTLTPTLTLTLTLTLIPNPNQVMLQRMPSSVEASSAEDLTAHYFGVA